MDQLFTCTQIVEGAWDFANPIYMCSVDLYKAYERYPLDILWEALWDYVVLEPLLHAILALFTA